MSNDFGVDIDWWLYPGRAIRRAYHKCFPKASQEDWEKFRTYLGQETSSDPTFGNLISAQQLFDENKTNGES